MNEEKFNSVAWGEQPPAPQFIDRRKPVAGWFVLCYLLGAMAALSPVIHIAACSQLPDLDTSPGPDVYALGFGFSAVIVSIACFIGCAGAHDIATRNDQFNDKLED